MKWKSTVLHLLAVAALILSGKSATVFASTTATHRLSTNKTSIAFGDVTLGLSSGYKLTLTNGGNAAVRVSRISISASEFRASGLSIPFTLSAGRTATLEIIFAPTKAGSVSGTVKVISNATNSPAETRVSGKGVAPEIATIPGNVSFGDVPVGMASTQTVTLSNHSSEYIDVTQVTANGPGLSLHGLHLPISIAPRHSSAFTLRFAPLKTGTVNGSVAIVSNATNSLLPVAVTGSGEAPVLKLSANPSALSFGSIMVGSTATKTVTLNNTGNAKISVSGIKVSGAGFGAHGYGLPFTLAAGQSATFNMEFAPAISGNSTGAVLVSSTASATPDSIALSGTGTQTSTHSVVLTWAPSHSSVVGYHIYRREQTTGSFARLIPSAVAGTTYTDTTVQTSTSYFYVATAVDAAGIESPFSNEISVVVP